MADVSGKFFSAKKVRTGVSPSSPGVEQGETLPPVNPPGSDLNSVGLSMPSAFEVANSPLTSNGTIAVTGAGTVSQYVRGDGSLASFPSLTGYVPYTGATQNVDLGEFGIDTGFVNLDTTPTNTPTTQGTIYWDDSRSTAALIMNGTLQHIGQDTFFYVKNSTGSSIAKGTAVRFDGTDGASGHLLIAPFLANGTYPSNYFMGVTAETIGNGGFGQVMHFGELGGINTSGYTAGALLYASTTVAGGFQTTAPVAPNNIVLIAAAINSKNNGDILVRPTYGSNINQDEGVKIVSPTTGQLLQLQSNGLWENKTKAQVLGGTSSQFVKGDGSLDSTTYQSTSEKGQPNGYASLDSNGKVPLAQINDALIGNVNYQGLWNAATNNPTLANPPSSGTKGYYYIVSTAGTFASISFEVGDWIISNGSAWQKVDNTDAVSSVFGRTGNVIAANGDYNTSQVTENTNLYFTQARVSANTDVAANTAARHNAVTLGTANGLSLSTQQLSLQLASGSQNGALSSTDWTTFNNKENAITAGTTAQYFRGDKTFQTLNTGAVPESGNLYFTNARAIASVLTGYTSGAGTISAADSILSAIQKLNGNIGGLVTGVSSVNGQTGAVTLTTSNIAEGTNLYFTQARVSANTDVAANTAARHNAVTLGTANGLSLSTQQLSLGLASAGVTGALSGTDWSTFNSKQQALNGTGFVKISGTTISYDNSTYLTTAAAASTYVTLDTAQTINGEKTFRNSIILKNQAAGLNGLVLSSFSPDRLQIGGVTYFSEIIFAATSRSYNLPDASGTIALVGGSGVGTVTSVAALTLGTTGTDLSSSVANSTTTPVITLNVPTASASNRGALSAADWTTFNSKENAITAGTTAQYYRGDKTFQTLNTAAVPELTNLYYTEARVNANANVAANTAARHNAVTLGTANGLSLSTQQLSLGLASSSANGALSSTDWTTFNNKQNALTNPVTGTGTTNYLPKFTGTSTIGNSSLFDGGGFGGFNNTGLGSRTFVINAASGRPFAFEAVEFANVHSIYVRPNNSGFNLISGNYLSGGVYLPLSLSARENNSDFVLSTSGNLGLGVTPSAWGVSGVVAKALQVNNVSLASTDTNGMQLSSNAFWNGSSWIYIASSVTATNYFQGGGTHGWRIAPSGTAGNAISFTQAMTLGSNSGLSIGTPSAAPSQGLLVQGEGRFSGKVIIGAGSSASSQLDVTSDGFANGITLRNRVSDDYAFFNWRNYNGTELLAEQYVQRTAANTAVMRYTINNGGIPATYLTIASTGEATFSSSVGIGIAPSQQLTIGGRSSAQMTIRSSTTTGSSEIYFGDSDAVFRGYIGYQHNGDYFEFATAASERMRITSGGNVGIGTTSPTRLLSVSAVNPQMTLKSTTTTGFSELYFGDTGADNGYLSYAHNGDYLVFGVNNSERMRIFSDGNVFIGSSPSNAGFKLDVNGTGRFGGGGSNGYLYVSGNAGAGGSTNPAYLQGMNFSWNKSNAQGESLLTYTNQGGGSNIRFGIGYWNNSTYSEQLSITNAGNVGIGTASPNYLLHIAAGAANPQLQFTSTGTGSTTSDGFHIGVNNSTLNAFLLQKENADLQILTNDTERMRITSGGELQLKQSSNSAQNSVIFNTTIQNAMTLNSSGFLILNGTTGSSRITCYGDGYFSGGIQTGNPYGSTSANWLLGRFLTETTSANGSIRVQIGSKYYNIAAEDLGTVPT